MGADEVVQFGQSAQRAELIEAGTAAFRRANLAMFFGGFATFAMLYGTQPILPRLTSVFGISPATASLSVSGGMAALAAMLIPASVLSDRFGRGPVMKWSLLLAALIACASAFASSFDQLLVLRIALGAVLAGLPAAAIAYLGEELSPTAQGRALGLYIAGNTLGGMSGRFIAAAVTDWSSWRVALAVLGLIGGLAAVIFWRQLPQSRHFRVRAAQLGRILADTRALFADRALPWLFLTAFLMMGAFVGLYNYLGFRLGAAPFGLGQTELGAIFLLYLVGTWSSAWSGQLADRYGRRRVLWMMITISCGGLLATLSSHLPIIIGGVAVFTFGYFGAHTTASGWTSRRAGERRALAAAIYLFSYYLGGSVIGSASGLAWDVGGWSAVVAVLGLCAAVALAIAVRLRSVTLPATNPALAADPATC